MRPMFVPALFVLCLFSAQAAVLRVTLAQGQTYSAQVRYAQAVQITGVTVQPRSGQTVTPQALAGFQKKYQETVRDAFEGLSGAYQITLTGRSTMASPISLPLKAQIDAPSFTMNLSLVLTPNDQGYLYQNVSPVNTLVWKGGGQPPLEQLRLDTRSYLIGVMTNANGPFGFETSRPTTANDGLRPEALGLANVAEGDLDAVTTLSWPEPLHFKTVTAARPGQSILLLGQLRAAVLEAAITSEGYVRGNFPDRLTTGTALRLRMAFPSGSDPVTVDVALTLTSTMTQTWNVQTK